MSPVLCVLAGLAAAQEAAIDGEWRFIGSQLSAFPVDDDGNTAGGRWLDHRLRTGVSGRPLPVVELDTQFDLAVGTVVSDPFGLQGTVDERRRFTGSAFGRGLIVPRRLAATTVAGNTQLAAGLVTRAWGLGIVANDGATPPLFGRSDYGDRTIRLRATHMPAQDGPPPRTTLLTTAAVDLVVADEIARLAAGERAVQGILSLLALGRRGSQVGTYFVARQQWEREPGRTTQAFVLDGYADAWHTLPSGLRLRTAAEVAGIAGRTNRATTYNARDRVGILSLGAAGQLTLAGPDEQVQAHLVTAYASGDGDPDDGVMHDFTFDRDFGAGMVLFDEVMAGIETAAWRQLTDPEVAGVPPDGVELLVTEGAFRRAAFAQPVVQVRPRPWLDLRAGVGGSWATAPFAQPFLTYRNGGVPTNHLGRPVEGRWLGAEADWSVAVFQPEPEGEDRDVARLSMQLQGGHLVVGPALDGPGMPGVVTLLTSTARMRW